METGGEITDAVKVQTMISENLYSVCDAVKIQTMISEKLIKKMISEKESNRGSILTQNWQCPNKCIVDIVYCRPRRRA